METEIESILTPAAGVIYRQILASIDNYESPSSFIGDAWGRYEEHPARTPTISGSILEFLICETLMKEGIKPYYIQAKFAHVPNSLFDIVLYDADEPVALSAKTSLRERYKQAALEGMALQQVYRRAKQYLITMNEREVNLVKAKIRTGDVFGLTDVLLANGEAYDALIVDLRQRNFQQATEIIPISGLHFVD